jgi:hypothetical protein
MLWGMVVTRVGGRRAVDQKSSLLTVLRLAGPGISCSYGCWAMQLVLKLQLGYRVDLDSFVCHNHLAAKG